jgi:predicted transcriptional regulator
MGIMLGYVFRLFENSSKSVQIKNMVNEPTYGTGSLISQPHLMFFPFCLVVYSSYAQIVILDSGLLGIEGCRMRRSKLEMYVDILKVLGQKGPLKLTHIMYKANVNCKVLKEYLDFLLAQGIVEERIIGKSRVVYANTQKGITVLKYFRELNKALPIIEEDNRPMPLSY